MEKNGFTDGIRGLGEIESEDACGKIIRMVERFDDEDYGDNHDQDQT
jgi:hypothetical protein